MHTIYLINFLAFGCIITLVDKLSVARGGVRCVPAAPAGVMRCYAVMWHILATVPERSRPGRAVSRPPAAYPVRHSLGRVGLPEPRSKHRHAPHLCVHGVWSFTVWRGAWPDLAITGRRGLSSVSDWCGLAAVQP